MNGLEVASPGLLPNSSLAPAEQCGQETPLENVLFASFYLLDFILAFVGNALALWLFIRDHKSGTPANVFLMHLAVADLSCVLVLPTRLVYHFSGNHWPFGEIPCRLTGFLLLPVSCTVSQTSIHSSSGTLSKSISHFHCIVMRVWGHPRWMSHGGGV